MGHMNFYAELWPMNTQGVFSLWFLKLDGDKKEVTGRLESKIGGT